MHLDPCARLRLAATEIRLARACGETGACGFARGALARAARDLARVRTSSAKGGCLRGRLRDTETALAEARRHVTAACAVERAGISPATGGPL